MNSAMNPDYTISIVYDQDEGRKDSITEIDTFLNDVARKQKFISGAIHISIFKQQKNSYIVCIPKELNDYLSGDGKKFCQEQKWNIVRYRVFNKKFNKSEGFYVCKNIESFLQIMTKLEGKFIAPNSYQIVKPPADNGGKKEIIFLLLLVKTTKETHQENSSKNLKF